MNKSEIIFLLQANDVKSTNLNTFIRTRRKAVREVLEAKREQIIGWLQTIEAKAAKAAQIEQETAKAKAFGMSRAEMLRLTEKAKAILSTLHTGHSMGCYRRLFVNGKMFAENDTLETYSKSCKYSPTYGTVRIDLNKSQLRRVLIESKKDNYGRIIRTVTLHGKTLTEYGSKSRYTVRWTQP